MFSLVLKSITNRLTDVEGGSAANLDVKYSVQKKIFKI